MFTAALLTAVKTWKPPKCPLMDERVGKMSSVHTLEHYSAFKPKENLQDATWMKLTTLGH